MAIKQISTITFARLSNAYHVAFFSDVKAAIDKNQYENLGLDNENYGRFDNAVLEEQDIVNRSRASLYTPKLQEYDNLRDNYFRRVYYKLRNAENDSLNEKMTPELINNIRVNILNQYGLDICNEPNQKETAKIRGFIRDIRANFTMNLADLEIATDLETLETANDNYEKTYVARLEEQATLPTTSKLREETEAAYLAITYLIAAFANSTSLEQADRMKRLYCERIIDQLNLLIRDFKQKAYPSGSGRDDEEEILDENPEAVEESENN